MSALLKTEAVTAYIFRAWLSHSFSLWTSLRQLEEMRLTFQKPYLKAHIKPHRVGRHINNLLNFAEFVSSSPPVVRSADPEDDYLLAMCAAGRADLLVTGDKNHLLSLKTHGRTQIITAREFAERLR